ncbi:armadillo-type protein [Armillaria novae-zelandiae]|uniref:Armadillo-type protein n=1 Tax=Armillaria novae-zelandiae TaxID=153914 RepID=A0AA39UF92_9AGAR|nr:armadillo-type protein [Armillaria novae-zelandiae]
MAIETMTVSHLKQIKNNVIGNPSVKLQCARDEVFIQMLVECLNREPVADEPQGSKDDIRIEAAHIITSISYGSEDALGSLLRADVHRVLLFAIAKIQPTDSTSLRAAFARALRAITVAVAETVGPSQWGLRADSSAIRNEAKVTLDFLFRIESLDIYLPLLVDPSIQTSTSIALLLGSALRTAEHRTAVAEWLPVADRAREIKTKRGWEKTSTNSSSLYRHGGWAARNLSSLLLTSKDYKYQEGLLLALAALCKDNATVAVALTKPIAEKDATLLHILSLSKSRIPEVQLAACLCAIHIIRSSASHSAPVDDYSARTILSVVNRMIATPPTDTVQNRCKACFILYYLVTDEAILCHIAWERGSLRRLAALVQSITPQDLNEREEEEPESVSALREAALTAIAAISMFDNDIRRSLTDDLKLLPTIHVSLSHRHVGVRYAACQCIRALSRAVAVLRTNLVDSGLGMVVFQVFKKEDEDRRVLSAALSAVCNIVNEFSPLRPVYLKEGLLPRLIQFLGSGDPTLRLSALWAIKNLLRKTSLGIKKDVMNQIGWPQLSRLLIDPAEGIQEQAFNIVRNLAEDEDAIDMVFEGLGTHILLERLVETLESRDEDVVLQAASLLANLANGSDVQQELILSCPKILVSLKVCLAESKPEIRRPAVGCILELARRSSKGRKEMVENGILSTLRHICEWSGGGLTMSHAHTSSAIEEEKDIIEHARLALDWLEHSP